MIRELLTNPVWLAPQMDYLLWLQNFRLQMGGVFDTVFLNITAMGEFMLPVLLISIIYWAINFEAGAYLFSLSAFNLFVVKFLKMTACLYRPWILDERIQPIESALKMASGYSFPSGHTAGAVSTWGGLAFILRKKKKLLSVILVLIVLMVAFSRNYVGVHTPQDVVASLVVGFTLIFGVDRLLKWCKAGKNNDIKLIVVMNVLGILAYFYEVHKSYPIDYAGAQLLVDPQVAIHSAVVYSGWILGLLNGIFFCRRFFPFNPVGKPWKKRLLICLIGIILLFVAFIFAQRYVIFATTAPNSLSFFTTFVIGMFITLVYPAMFRKYLG